MTLDKRDKNKEIIIFAALVGGFFLIGIDDGLSSALSSMALGLIVWVIWRGRKL